MRTRPLASALIAALALTATTVAPLSAHADEPAAAPAAAADAAAAPAADPAAAPPSAGEVLAPLARDSSQRADGADGAAIAPMPVPVPPAQVDQVETVWYGYQNLGADGAAFALVVAAGGSHNSGTADALGWLGFGTYVLGSPIIHAMHGGGAGRSLGSAAMRLGLPVLGGVIGAGLVSCTDSGGDDGCGWDMLGGAALGGLIGIGTAIVIDDFMLANEERHVTRPMWAPTVAPSAGGMTFGVAGTF